MLYRNRPDRRRVCPPCPTIQPLISYVISDPAIANKLRLTFSAPVLVTGMPNFHRVDSTFAALPAPDAYTVIDETTVDLHFAAAPLGANFAAYFTANDANTQGRNGGYVTAQPQAWIAP